MFFSRRLVLALASLGATGGLRASERALELVMVERAGCSWCERWNREVAPAYEKTAEGRRAPLRRHSLEIGQPRLVLTEPVRFTPTFLLVEGGREIGRITGYLENGMFWGLLEAMLKRVDAPSERTKP
ncbi:MAG: hypothetical protein LCH61_14215 [Proteobacteria bacterium]|nr:hypothetical protein [Pseudomonadota bacterium]